MITELGPEGGNSLAAVPQSGDATAYLNSLLSLAASLNFKLIIPPAAWSITQLVVPSGSNVDATGATFSQPSGVNRRMIVNPSLLQATPGTTRDSNIAWVGGTFLKGTGQQNVGKLAANNAGLEDHCTMFGFVDKLTVKNITITQSGTGGDAGTGGRYGCYVWNCTDFEFDHYYAQSVSAAVNQSTLQIAFSQNGLVRNVYAQDGDDSVALVNGNQASDMLTNGLSATENITIDGVFGSAPSNGVRVMGGSTNGIAPFYPVQHCAIRNVRVSSGSRGTAGAVFIGGDVGGTYPNLQGGTVQDCEFADIEQLRAATPAAWIAGQAEVWVTLRRINNQNDSTAPINIPDGSGHQRIRIADVNWSPTATSGASYFVSCPSNVCRSLEFTNFQISAATTGAATVGLVNGTGGPGWLIANNVRTTGKNICLGTFTSTTRIVANGINGEDVNSSAWFVTNTGAAVTVRAWNACATGGTNSFTQTAGSVATNDPRVPGASGTAVLVGGTVTVNTGTGMATASSLIRLTTLVGAGANTGHCFVSARGAGTFTITSTNAADTSTIFWEIVNS